MASWPRRFIESLAPLTHYRCDWHPDAVVINQGGHCFAEDSEAACPEPSSAEPAFFYPSVDSPSTDVQDPGSFVDTEQPLLLQDENCVHDASPRTQTECRLNKGLKHDLPRRPSLTTSH